MAKDKNQAQETYNQQAKNLSADDHEILCGSYVLQTEKIILDQYTKPNDKVLEIGCGTFHRLGSEYTKRQLDFLGVEPLANIVAQSRYPDRTIHDVFSTPFLSHPEFVRHTPIRIAIAFGGVLGAHLSEERQHDFWSAIELLLRDHARYLVIDTLIDTRGFSREEFEQSPEGRVIRVLPMIPLQYFPSLQEFTAIWNRYHLHVVAYHDDSVFHHLCRYWVLEHNSKVPPKR